jgi:3'(2'), 5'-bisphosphate nucleotidase
VTLTHFDAESTDVDLAAALAWRAGRLLRDIRDEAGAFDDPKALGDLGDTKANDLILAGLSAVRPRDVVLSEESADDVRRLTADRVWIIDPLDGTKQFKSPGSSEWAVHIALWERSANDGAGGLTAAAVSLPMLNSVFTTEPNLGASYRHDWPTPATPRLLVSDSRPPDVSTVVDAIGATVVPMGSAGAKILAVVRGDADAYVHSGGQYQWDSAAPVAIALAHGYHASRIDGSPLVYNEPDLAVPDLVVCRPDLADAILRALIECRK